MTRSHDRLLDEIRDRLESATSRRTGFTLAQLGTVDENGAPGVRAVILRRFDREAAELSFATHAASEKVAQLAAEPRVALACYDEAAGVQLRITGFAEIVQQQDARRAAWESLAPHSRAQYRLTASPGRAEDDEEAFRSFTWVSIGITGLDWLDLSGDEHVRYRFTRSSAGSGSASRWTCEPVLP